MKRIKLAEAETYASNAVSWEIARHINLSLMDNLLNIVCVWLRSTCFLLLKVLVYSRNRFFAPLDTRKKGQQNPIEYVYKIV